MSPTYCPTKFFNSYWFCTEVQLLLFGWWGTSCFSRSSLLRSTRELLPGQQSSSCCASTPSRGGAVFSEFLVRNSQPERETRGKGEFFIMMMMGITGPHLLCLFLLAFPLSWAEDTEKDVRKKENDTVWVQARTRRLFARRKFSPPPESRTPKHKANLVTPAHRCGRLMENCSAYIRCCDPCASCRCRLFNTICHCWRTNPACSMKT